MPERITEGEIIKHDSAFVRQKGRLRLFVASTTTISFSAEGEHRQICQVGFNSDGSIRIAWPYLAVQQGIVSRCEIPADGQSHTVELREQGKFTSQLVKFSHHTTGQAHFNLSGRTTNEIRRDSFPLTGPIGRIFELTATIPRGFKELTRLKRDRLYVDFTGKNGFPNAVQIRGEWRRKADTVANTWPKRGSVGPVTMRRHRATGEIAPVAFIAPPLACPIQTHLLWLTCHPAPLPNGATRSGIIFIGGFDGHESTARSASTPVHLNRFLSAMFPTSSSEDVQRAVGSIDLTVDALDDGGHD